MIAFFAHQIDHLRTKVHSNLQCRKISKISDRNLYSGKSIRGDDVLWTPPVILPLPGVLVVGHTAVRVQGHIVRQVLTITHLKGGTIDEELEMSKDEKIKECRILTRS